MAAGTFEQTSLDWQLQQIFQQLGEWFEFLLSRFNGNPAMPDMPQIPEWFWQSLFWLLVAVAIAWSSWQLFYLLRPYWQHWQAGSTVPQIVIPAQPQQSVAAWLQQAHTAHQQGDYQSACRFLYLAVLQRLNDRGLIGQEGSRTDGEYLSLLRSLKLPPPYQVLIQTHERLHFDRMVASAETYDRCWRAYQEIERS